jgi:hypothetical protein
MFFLAFTTLHHDSHIFIFSSCYIITAVRRIKLKDAVLDSLCPKDSGEIFHKAECLNRNCSECGVEKLDFLPEELDTSDSCDDETYVIDL